MDLSVKLGVVFVPVPTMRFYFIVHCLYCIVCKVTLEVGSIGLYKLTYAIKVCLPTTLQGSTLLGDEVDLLRGNQQK